MTWSYSGDPAASDLDAVRYIIGDTSEDMSLLTDEEIKYELSKNEDVNLVSLACLDKIIAALAKEVSYTIGPEKVTAGDKYKQYLAVRDKLQKDLLDSSAVPLAAIPDSPSCFDVGMHDCC